MMLSGLPRRPVGRFLLLGLATAVMVLMSGCGAVPAGHPSPAQTAPPSASAATTRPDAPSGASEGTAKSVAFTIQVPTATPYQPAAVIRPPAGLHRERFSLPLIPGTGVNTVTVTVDAAGHGQLQVIGSDGKPLWQLNHVQWAGALEFRRHPPVLLTEGDPSFCGSGGCLFTGYTYTYLGGRGQMAPVPFAPWNAPRHRYQPARHAWSLMPELTAAPGVGEFLGSVKLNPNGIIASTRTYNVFNGLATVHYRYAAVAGAPAGEWMPVGPVAFSPAAPYPGYLDRLSPSAALAMYLTAATDNTPALAAPLTLSPTAAAQAWAAAAPLVKLGLSGSVNPAPLANPAHPGQIAEEVTGTVGSGPATRLEAFIAEATVVTGNSLHRQPRLRRITLTPISLRVSSLPQVLARLEVDPAVTAWFRAHPKAWLTVTPMGTLWTVSYSDGQSGRVNAVSGTVTGSP